MGFSAQKLLKSAQTKLNAKLLHYMATLHYRYFVLINNERDSRVIIPIENYKGMSQEDDVLYILTKEPIVINGKNSINCFELDFKNDDDIIACLNKADAIDECKGHYINTSQQLTSKLIFSPQLANYLLDCGFQVIHLKRHERDGSIVFVFKVENGFYEAISRYRRGE